MALPASRANPAADPGPESPERYLAWLNARRDRALAEIAVVDPIRPEYARLLKRRLRRLDEEIAKVAPAHE